MIRSRNLFLLAALAAMLVSQTSAQAANVWLSLNLQFNTPGNVNSGGTWTTVAKADERGLAAANMQLANVNFSAATGFIAPSQLEIKMTLVNGLRREVLVADDPSNPPPTLDVGVIGGPFPSTYVDAPGLVPFGGNPNLGSFTGGVALATGTFNPGIVPQWYNEGGNFTQANGYISPNFPGGIVAANVLLTVRHVIPEPATLGLACMGLIGLIAASRRSVN